MSTTEQPPILVIVNPRAGGAPEGRALAEALEPLGEVRVAETTAPGHAAELAGEAASDGVERIVVVGGDGTLHDVVNGLDLPAAPLLGIAPAGTGNDLARSLGVPLDVSEAIEVVRSGDARATDAMSVSVDGSTEVAVNAACGGFGGEVNARLTQELKDRWGPFAYVKASLDALTELPRYHVRLEIDARDMIEIPIHSLVVANGAYAAHGVNVAPGARPDDGTLDVHAVLPRPITDLLAVAPAVLRGEVPEADHYRVWTCRTVEVHTAEPMEVSVDGELRRGRSFRYEVRPSALRIIRPRVVELPEGRRADARTTASRTA